ncbi:MAG: hypothetical protein ACTH4Y_11685 [Microbacterium gubbeenense]|uniref:hypothetical protein n=1 Tax=Microbacterium gubbeenense TaxID=159896 RepID=UPI003F943920
MSTPSPGFTPAPVTFSPQSIEKLAELAKKIMKTPDTPTTNQHPSVETPADDYADGLVDGMEEIWRFILAEYGLATLHNDISATEDKHLQELFRRIRVHMDGVEGALA